MQFVQVRAGMSGLYVDRGQMVAMCPLCPQWLQLGGGVGLECRVPRLVTMLGIGVLGGGVSQVCPRCVSALYRLAKT